MNVTKINKCNEKKTTNKLNSTSTAKAKTNKYTGRLRYTMNAWRTLLKLKKTKKKKKKTQKKSEVQSIKE